MQRGFLMVAALGLSGCLAGGYTSAEIVYREPVEYVYVEPIDHVVVVSRQVLVTNGYTVYRVTHSGPNRVIWARRGGDEMLRIFVSPSGQYVEVRGLVEVRDRDKERGWERRGSPNRVLAALNGRLKRRGRDRDR